MQFVFYAAAALCIVAGAISFLLCRLDKSAARRRKQRIPERYFLCLCFLGGAFGLTAGMLVFHHKTRHVSFVTAACVGMLLWSGVLVLLAMLSVF